MYVPLYFQPNNVKAFYIINVNIWLGLYFKPRFVIGDLLSLQCKFL